LRFGLGFAVAVGDVRFFFSVMEDLKSPSGSLFLRFFDLWYRQRSAGYRGERERRCHCRLFCNQVWSAEFDVHGDLRSGKDGPGDGELCRSAWQAHAENFLSSRHRQG
jgi:hypothetical protein